MSVNVCPDDIFSKRLIVSAQNLLNHSTICTKLDILVYYYEAVYPVEKSVQYLQCQGHSKGLYNQNMIISVVSSKLLVSLQQNLV